MPDGNDTMDWTSRLFTAKVADQVVAHAEASISGFNTAVGWAT